ncbi:hypothetical protein ACLOJK_036160 [Asimina triloba]
MEGDDEGFLQELLALRRDTLEDQLMTCGERFDYFKDNPSFASLYPPSEGLPLLNQPAFAFPPNQVHVPFEEEVSAAEINPSARTSAITEFPIQEACLSIVEHAEVGLLSDHLNSSGKSQGFCDTEETLTTETPNFSVGSRLGFKNRANTLKRQPSKNLMAERRRRKRLNDRLSMLRSVVPKISKMDRTSILSDAIDYVKELLDKIKNLQEEIQVDSNYLNAVSTCKENKPEEIQVTNAPKFVVEQSCIGTRIEISCAAKTGLLLSTIATLEASGLGIQHCVATCFGDFGMQASCFEDFSLAFQPQKIVESHLVQTKKSKDNKCP